MSKERNMERNGSCMLNVNLTIWSDTHVAYTLCSPSTFRKYSCYLFYSF